MLHAYLPFIVTGLVSGAVYGLAGEGLVLTYKTSGIFNIGYGAIAASAAYVFYALWGQHGWPWAWAAVFTLVVYAPVVGIALELMARSLDGASEKIKVVATVGLILIIQSIASLWFPDNPPAIPHFLPQETVKVLGVFITWEQIIIFGFALAASGILFWFFKSLRAGIVMRGIVDSHELVSMSGDSPIRVRRWAWLIGTVFAAIAGLLLAPGQPIDGVSLPTLVFGAFGAAAIGYFSSMPLTLVGGLLIGVAGALLDKFSGTISWVGGLAPSLPFIVLFVVLIVTPRGRLASRRIATQIRVRPSYHAPARLRLLAGVVAVGLLALIPLIQSGQLVLWSNALISIMLLLSLGLLVRNSGQISLCHLAFAAVGAAAFGHFASTFGIPWLLALLLAALVAVPVGALIAIPAVRLSGVFLALATLGFGLVAQDVFYSQNFMFGTNELGLTDPRPHASIGGWHLDSDKGFYYLLLIITVLIVVAVTVITSGRLGRLLHGMSDSQLALETRGTTSSVLKVIIFCITAAMAAMTGALTGMVYGYSAGSYFPTFGSLELVVLVIIIVMGDPWYAVLGAVGYTVIPGYVQGNTVTSLLTMLFGIGAVLAVFTTRFGGVPMPVQTLLDRLGGRRKNETAAGTLSLTGGDRQDTVVQARTRIPENEEAGLTVQSISVFYGGVRAVDGASLRAPLGRITGLIGPNGAGKTTFFNACCGLVRPNGGQVLLGGEDLTRSGPAHRARQGLGRTFQRPELFDSLTVRQNVELGCEAAIAGGNPISQTFESRSSAQHIAAAAAEAIDLTAIGHLSDLQVGLLPIGQKRLVELATVMAGRFDVILLDEPSSGLDGRETEAFGAVLLQAMARRNLGILLVEHDMTLVRNICDYLYVLDFGSMIFEGTPAEMEDSEKVRSAYLGEQTSVPLRTLNGTVPERVNSVAPSE